MEDRTPRDPISNKFSLRCRAVYDSAFQGTLARRYYCGRGYYSFGYWAGKNGGQAEAAEALVKNLVSGIEPASGPVLDVACGLGANAEMLSQTFGGEAVYGINISERQLSECEARVPQAHFLLMDATELIFPRNFFSALFCVEAAFHFDTRERFLWRALEVLREGGSLRMTDIVCRKLPWRPRSLLPPGNFLKGAEEYAQLLARIGFVEIEVSSIWKQSWIPFRSHLLGWLWSELIALRLSPRELFIELPLLLAGIVSNSIEFRDYLMIKAKKSGEGILP
ncbi:MAG: class I SAM-dependent methyltransferase [Bdellovibrionota bacterium]